MVQGEFCLGISRKFLKKKQHLNQILKGEQEYPRQQKKEISFQANVEMTQAKVQRCVCESTVSVPETVSECTLWLKDRWGIGRHESGKFCQDQDRRTLKDMPVHLDFTLQALLKSKGFAESVSRDSGDQNPASASASAFASTSAPASASQSLLSGLCPLICQREGWTR